MVKNYGIHDEWKDLNKVNDIDIKSIDGVIDSIKVNGEEAGGGGGGDLTTANVTLICSASDEVRVELPLFEEAEPPFNPNAHSYASISLYNGDELVKSTILYKGRATGEITGATNITGSGAVEVNNNIITISGDCTITIS